MAEVKKKRKRRRRRTGRTLAIVLACLALFFVLAAVAAYMFLRYTNSMHAGMFADRSSAEMQEIRRQRDEVSPPEEDPLGEADWIDEEGNAFRYRDDVLTVLIMGIDNMTDPSLWDPGVVSNGGNADVLALITLETETNRLTILYIPRDTVTDMIMLDAQGNYLDTVTNNISASHSYGDGGELSCELTADAVSKLLYGIPINRFAAMDFESIPVMNQVLDGLEITFPDDYTKLNSEFKQGATVRLTDSQLEKLIRYRDHSETDGAYKRGLRDLKLVLNAMFRQVKQQIKEDPTSALRMFRELSPYMTTNFSADEVSYLAQQLNQLQFSGDAIVQIPGVVTHGEKYVEFYPDADWLRDYVVSNYCIKLN